MSLAQRMHFLQDVFEMTTIALVSGINHNYINGLHLYMHVFTNSSTWEGYDSRLIFKQNLTGLNSEFFFAEIGCLTKIK